MNIVGLSKDFYLINNPLNILVDGFTDAKYLQVTFINSFTNKTASLRVYPINDTFKFDISGFIKSSFFRPNYFSTTPTNLEFNLTKIDLSFTLVYNNNTTESVNIIKNFIRGGNNEGFYPNLNRKYNFLQDGDVVEYLIVEKLPIWSNVLNSSTATQIENEQFVTIETTEVERLEFPCKGIKMIFLNQYGTYSEWFFNHYEINDKTKHIDIIDLFQTDFTAPHFNDIGSNVETSITVKDNIPLRFNELIRHLIVSLEIYVVINNELIRVSLNSSKWEFNSKEKMYKHSITFDFAKILNPSDLC
jgi:hypothetical protein